MLGWRRWLTLTAPGTVAIAGLALLEFSQRHAAPAPGSAQVGPEPLAARDLALEQRAQESGLGRSYQELRERYSQLPHAELLRRLRPQPAAADPLSFDPKQALYYPRIAQELQLTSDEARVFAEQGMVSVDHRQRYSMGSAYHAIYARDLPLLVTTDSILHALHRSYDQTLKELEQGWFSASLRSVLRETESELERSRDELDAAGLQASADDVALYVAVARRLLDPEADLRARGALLPQVATLIAHIDSLTTKRIELFGGARTVDFSQFRPRGHYAETPELQRYFRALSWLGRTDLAFMLGATDPRSGLVVDAARERRNAALLGLLLTRARQAEPLAAMSNAVGYLVGRSDAVTPRALADALSQAGATDYRALGDAARLERAFAGFKVTHTPLVLSQAITTLDYGPPTSLPPSFQLFGQRLTPDAFVLSHVVYDSITFEDKKPERWLPSGLDVMAALGSDTATQLLEPELERYHYAPNLLALREALDAQVWQAASPNLYIRWLSALRPLDDVPQVRPFPEVMRRPAWQRKQLQTQLSSWAELRHDTVLYAKQSYTSVPSCGYPDAYVEPYPEFYRSVRALADGAVSFLATLNAPQATYWRELAATMVRLEAIAEKELRAAPLAAEERRFLARTINQTGGSGPPRYTGWYAQLIYRPGWRPNTERYGFGDGTLEERDQPDAWRPTVADVHTNPGSDRSRPAVLEAGVGDVEFLVVAIERQGDVAAYVGPVSSYYEFTQPPEARLDDAAWQQRIAAERLPARPAWSDVFRAPASSRLLDETYRSSGERKLELEGKICKLRELWLQTPDEQAREPWQQLLQQSERELSHIAEERVSDPRVELPSSDVLDAKLAALDARPFDAHTARERLLAQEPALDVACGESGKGAAPLRVRVTFRPNGAVEHVELLAPAAQDLAACAERILSRVWAPRFGGSPASLTLDFKPSAGAPTLR